MSVSQRIAGYLKVSDRTTRRIVNVFVDLFAICALLYSVILKMVELINFLYKYMIILNYFKHVYNNYKLKLFL